MDFAYWTMFEFMVVLSAIVASCLSLFLLWAWSIRIPAGYRIRIQPAPGENPRWRCSFAPPGGEFLYYIVTRTHPNSDASDYSNSRNRITTIGPFFLARSIVAHEARVHRSYNRHNAQPVREFGGPPLPDRPLPNVVIPKEVAGEDREFLERQKQLSEPIEYGDAPRPGTTIAHRFPHGQGCLPPNFPPNFPFTPDFASRAEKANIIIVDKIPEE